MVVSRAREAGEMGGGEEEVLPEVVSAEVNTATTRTARLDDALDVPIF